MVTKEILEEFKLLYQEEFNISITDEEATQMTTELVNLMSILLQPEPQETNNEERRQDENITTPTS